MMSLLPCRLLPTSKIMNLSRSKVTAFVTAIAASRHLAHAFSSKPSSSLGLAASFHTKTLFVHHNNIIMNTRTINKISSTALPMIFDKFFSSALGGAGAFGAKIDYTAIPFPVPELASIASDGQVAEEIERDGKSYKLATFAGGCFWGLELAYQRVPGVEYTAVGYTQGPESEPNYDAVCAGCVTVYSYTSLRNLRRS